MYIYIGGEVSRPTLPNLQASPAFMTSCSAVSTKRARMVSQSTSSFEPFVCTRMPAPMRGASVQDFQAVRVVVFIEHATAWNVCRLHSRPKPICLFRHLSETPPCIKDASMSCPTCIEHQVVEMVPYCVVAIENTTFVALALARCHGPPRVIDPMAKPVLAVNVRAHQPVDCKKCSNPVWRVPSPQ